MTADITETLTCVEGRGFIWILYAARDSILASILNECNSMTVTFFSNNQDMTVHSCGNQVVFDQNMEELMETIMQCSTTTSESWSSENITRQQSLDDHDHHHSSHHKDNDDRNVGDDDDDDDDNDSDDDCYMMQGKITDPQTACTVGEILKVYHVLCFTHTCGHSAFLFSTLIHKIHMNEKIRSRRELQKKIGVNLLWLYLLSPN